MNSDTKVKLIECGRRSCGHILIDSERDWMPDPYSPISNRAICPKCGEDGFYTLNEMGQQITMRDLDKYQEGIDPMLIEPSNRMGLKRRRRILSAKRRALDLVNSSTSKA